MPPPPLCAPGPPALSAAAMGSLLSRRIAGVEDIDIQANSAYRYPPKSGEGRGEGDRPCRARCPPGRARRPGRGLRECLSPPALAERPWTDACGHSGGTAPGLPGRLRREGVSVSWIRGSAVPLSVPARRRHRPWSRGSLRVHRERSPPWKCGLSKLLVAGECGGCCW